MDISTTYRTVVKDVISQYAKLRPSHGQIRLDTVFDEQQDHYALMQVGWDRGVRVRGNLIYVTLQNDKIFVEYDGIEQGIIEELIKRGVAKDKIVLPSLLPLNEKPVTVSVDNQKQLNRICRTLHQPDLS